MPAPSSLAIATGVLTRLVKEEASYHREYDHQSASIAKMEEQQRTNSGDGDENAEYMLRQERKALSETQAIFPGLKLKMQDALSRLAEQLEKDKGSENVSSEETNKAKGALAAGEKAVREL